MEKQRFYVSVGLGLIMPEPSSPYEFEIDASHEEISRLQQQFEKTHVEEMSTFVRAHAPYVQYHDDAQNDLYDQSLINLYRMIHQLGTPETKQHIESMSIL